MPLLELAAARKLRKNHNVEDVMYERNKAFQRAIPDAIILASDIVIGFDTSSWILADRCKKLGKKFILDLSIAHPLSKVNVYRNILRIYPEWSFALKQKSEAFIALEQVEMEIASHIVVASTFTRDTLIDNRVPTDKISVNPYGVNAKAFSPVVDKKMETLHFVFVGLVDARKGIPLLLEVWQEFVPLNVTLTLIGPVSYEIKSLIVQRYPFINLKGRISFNELMEDLPKYHVMIFPSYFEGFGLVIPEAMACGLPVITTRATCGPDIITNYHDGIVIEPGNKSELRNAIKYFVNSTSSYSEMARHARNKALLYSWETYGERWKNLLSHTLID